MEAFSPHENDPCWEIASTSACFPLQTNLLEDEHTRHAFGTTLLASPRQAPSRSDQAQHVGKRDIVPLQDNTILNHATGGPRRTTVSTGAATGTEASAAARDGRVARNGVRWPAPSATTTRALHADHDNASWSNALSASDLRNALLLWPSAIKGKPVTTSACFPVSKTSATTSFESPSKRQHPGEAVGGRGASSAGSDESPFLPFSSSIRGGDEVDGNAGINVNPNSNASNVIKEAFCSPGEATQTTRHVARGRVGSERGLDAVSGSVKEGSVPMSPFHLFAGTQLSPISSNSKSSDQFAGGSPRPLYLKPLPFPRAMLMEYDDDDDDEHGSNDAAATYHHKEGKATERQGDFLLRPTTCSDDGGDREKANGDRTEGRSRDSTEVSEGGRPDPRQRSPSPDLLSTILSPPTLPGSDAMEMGGDEYGRANCREGVVIGSRSAPSDVDKTRACGGDGGGQGSGDDADATCLMDADKTDAEMQRVDLCDPEWSLNPVLAPMPLPNDDESRGGEDDIRDADGTASARKRQLHAGGRLVHVHSVNPEAQISVFGKEAATAPSAKVHGEALVSPEIAGAVGVGARRGSGSEGNGARTSVPGTMKKGTKKSGSKKRRQLSISASNKNGGSLRRNCVPPPGVADASAASVLSSCRALSPASLSAGEVFSSPIAEATAPATPKHSKSFREVTGRSSLEGVADVARSGADFERPPRNERRGSLGEITRNDGSGNDGSRASDENANSVGSGLADVSTTAWSTSTQPDAVMANASGVSSFDGTNADFCTPLGNGSQPAFPNFGVPARVDASSNAKAVGVTRALGGTAGSTTETKDEILSSYCGAGQGGCKYPPGGTSTPVPKPAATLRAVHAVFRGDCLEREDSVRRDREPARPSRASSASGAQRASVSNNVSRLQYDGCSRIDGDALGGRDMGIDDSSSGNRGGGAAGGRRQRPAGKTLAGEMFSPAESGAGRSGVYSTRTAADVGAKVPPGGCEHAAAVLPMDGDSLPGPAIMAELNKRSGNGSKPEKNARAPCTCKKCKCLKLYCDCFAGSRYCGPACLCNDCHNKQDEEVLQEARKTTLEKNPEAFKRAVKLSKDPATVLDGAGCGCTRSQCLKKYCVCFSKAVRCGSTCNCEGCMNKVGDRSQNKHMGRSSTSSFDRNDPRTTVIITADTATDTNASSGVGLSTPSWRNNPGKGLSNESPSTSSSPPSSSSSSSVPDDNSTEQSSESENDDIDLDAEEAELSEESDGFQSSPSRTFDLHDINVADDDIDSNKSLGNLQRIQNFNFFSASGTDATAAPLARATKTARDTAAGLFMLPRSFQISPYVSDSNPEAIVRRSEPSTLGSKIASGDPTAAAAAKVPKHVTKVRETTDFVAFGGSSNAHDGYTSTAQNGEVPVDFSSNSSPRMESSTASQWNAPAKAASVRRGGRSGSQHSPGLEALMSTEARQARGTALSTAAVRDGSGGVQPATFAKPRKKEERERCGSAGRSAPRKTGHGSAGGELRGDKKRYKSKHEEGKNTSESVRVSMTAGNCRAMVLPTRRDVVLESPADTLLDGNEAFGPSSRGFKKRCGELAFSFLDNDDVYNASLVSDSWCKLAMSSALWQA